MSKAKERPRRSRLVRWPSREMVATVDAAFRDGARVQAHIWERFLLPEQPQFLAWRQG